MRLILALLLALLPVASQAQQLPAPSYRKLTITGSPSSMVFQAPGSPATTLDALLNKRFSSQINDITTNTYTGFGPYTAFGNTDALARIHSRRTGTQPSILGTLGISRDTLGSGTFGAGALDFALFVANKKINWNTTSGAAAGEGEVDGLLITTQQGKKGDTAALFMDTTKRRDTLNSIAADESGTAIMVEGNVGLQAADGTVYHRMHAALGFPETPGGVSQGRGFGAWMETRAGYWFSAYHAGSINGADESGVSVPNGWINYFTGSTGRTPETVNYKVDQRGWTFSGFPGAQVTYGYDPGTDSLLFQDGAAQTLASIGRTSKVITGAGGIQVGTGTITTYRNAASVSATIPSLPSLGAGTLSTVTVAGAKPGDMVSAEIISADAGLAGFRVSGVVTALNTVQLRIQNLSPDTAGGSQVSVTAKVERFQ